VVSIVSGEHQVLVAKQPKPPSVRAEIPEIPERYAIFPEYLHQ
jgi:hypothetical protein